MGTEDKHAVRHVVVTGGGSAGWITAGLIAAGNARRAVAPVQVTLVESPRVGTIGVGEGTWPTMRTTMHALGISEADFLAACSATFKQGTRFVGWVSGHDPDIYYHPFTAPAGYPGIDLAPWWRREHPGLSFTDAVSPQGMVCDRDLGPKQAQTPEYAGVLNYAYHLDAGKFAALLADHCTGALGVRHVLDHITGVESAENGDIAALRTATEGAVEGDLFVDCSGIRSMLLGDHYGVPFLDRSDVLFNDTALAVQVPYAQPDTPIASQTISTARAFGWIWDIGLVERRGVGHVYSSRHGSEEQATSILEEYLNATGTPPDAVPTPRRISFAPGHRERFWHRNCVAVGMSAGFIEPLEASALVMVELSARMISEELPANRHLMDIVARRFNEKFRYRWARIIDFLKLHYVLSQREDSDYWRDNRARASIPESLQDLLALWRHRPPGLSDFPNVDEIFPAASYQYVLYGMAPAFAHGLSPPGDAQSAKARELYDNNVRQANRCLAGLPPNRALLEQIARQGLPAAG